MPRYGQRRSLSTDDALGTQVGQLNPRDIAPSLSGTGADLTTRSRPVRSGGSRAPQSGLPRPVSSRPATSSENNVSC